MRAFWRIIQWMGKAVERAIIAALAVVLVTSAVALADYAATQGSGTTFASVVISTKHYMALLICDATAGESQCSAVNSSGQIAIQAPPSLPLPTGAATSANQTTGNSSLATIATNSAGVLPPGYTYAHISTATTTVVKSGAGVLHIINIGQLGTIASTVTIYDNTAGNGTVIGVLNSLTLSGAFGYDVAFATGLTLVTTGSSAPDLTVSFR